MYDQVASEGYHVNYARVAIVSLLPLVALVEALLEADPPPSPLPQTDEQAPLPLALDALVHRVLAALRSSADLSFNCQMCAPSSSCALAPPKPRN